MIHDDTDWAEFCQSVQFRKLHCTIWLGLGR